MKTFRKSKFLALLMSLAMVLFPIRVIAEDIDIFVGASGGTATNPNVLIILDNTSNWANSAQHWPGGVYQGQAELQAIKSRMRKHNIQVLKTEMNALGIEVEYKVRGYIHHFKMLRSLVKAELMTLLMDLRRRLK